MFLLNYDRNIYFYFDRKNLQYKMFLLNSDKNHPETEKILFTIQNVSIKYTIQCAKYDEKVYLQYKMFLLNNSRTTGKYRNLLTFTIQNVSIKLMKEQFAIATDKHLQYKMFLLNNQELKKKM
mgnify:CR=1 FL=1